MLTEARCKAAMPGKRPDGSPRRLMLRDERGLYLQVDQGADGVIKSWLYRYSVGCKDRTDGLGSYPEVNLAAARRLADACVPSARPARTPSPRGAPSSSRR